MRIVSLFAFLAAIATISFWFFVVEGGQLDNAHVITNCDGTQFIRTAPGEMRVQIVPANLVWCIGSGSAQFGADTITVSSDITNCSGLRIIGFSDGTYKSYHTEINLPECIKSESPVEIHREENEEYREHQIDLSHGPLLDLASTDIVNYRAKLLKDRGIRFANAIRSARIRRAATKKSETEAILMRGDAVIIEGYETGWVKVEWALLEVTDKNENTIEVNTLGRADGYTASRLLRDPNTSDLVRIEQADHAYWSDIAYTNVEKYVNVRANPNYRAPIITTLGNGHLLYIVSTIDNWSLVRNDDGTIQGYVRSDYLRIEKSQRVDTSLWVR